MAKTWGERMLMSSNEQRGSLSQRPFLRIVFLVLAVWYLLRIFISVSTSQWPPHPTSLGTRQSRPKCSQVEPLTPIRTSKDLDDMEEYLDSTAFRNASIERLSGAVKIPTQSFDDMGEVGKDPRWDIMYSFEDYLAKTFPLVHTTLQLENINTHGLLYTWPGLDPSLKPNLLMAHQDVVPVPESTVKQWTHPPFSGHYDGKSIWGRGSSDCKNQLIAILSAVESLISASFTPQRTLILSFGFDEEISGQEGAKHLSSHILSKYGHNSIVAIVDEGATNIEAWGQNWALPGVAEKGYVDIDIVVRMPGGHSSIPPLHNGIGVASELITLIEANPYEPWMDDENPYLALLYCGAEHAQEFPRDLKKLLNRRDSHQRTCKDKLAIEAAKAGPEIKYLFTTSVAVDLISGGVKTNALPERTQLTVNHRINVGSSSAVIFKHISSIAAKVSEKHNLTLTPFNGTEFPNSITLVHRDTVLEPAPITPTQFSSSPGNTKTTPFAVLSGTTRALYGTDLLVAPGIMTGNTDTRYYWDLSEHIFRYGPGWDKDQVGLGNIHTVDERIGVRAHLDNVKWFVRWIRLMDEADL